MTDHEKRLEWVAGPIFVSRPERMEWHAGKGKLEPKGLTIRLFVGQVRDRELGVVLNWAMEAPRNALNVNLELGELAERLPKAQDWTPRPKPNTAAIPTGWTVPSHGSEFTQGLVA